jgi:hypothetical protein
MAEVNVSVNPPVPAKNSYKIELVLNDEEAEALLSLVAQVTGNWERSFRGVTDKVYSKLKKLGVRRVNAFNAGRLFFREYEEY